jgi:hypothetical protein
MTAHTKTSFTAHTKTFFRQERVDTEECWSCGNYFVPGDRFENEFTRNEGGEKYSIFICDECKTKPQDWSE